MNEFVNGDGHSSRITIAATDPKPGPECVQLHLSLEPDEVVALWQWHVERYWAMYAICHTCFGKQDIYDRQWHANRREELMTWWTNAQQPIPPEIATAEAKGERKADEFIRSYAEE